MELTEFATYRNVLGGLMKSPLLFTQYTDIKTEDFGGHKVSKIIFATINNMFQNGISTMTPIEVDMEIERYEAAATIYRAEKGLDYLNDCYEYSALDNFDYYYKRLKKLSLIRTLKKNHYDVSYFFKEDCDTLQEENELIERFDKATMEDILQHIERNYNEIRSAYLTDAKVNAVAADGVRALIDNFKVHPEIGFDMEGSLFSYACRGARLGKFYLRSAQSGTGKAIVNTTPIPMADGTWKTVGEVRPGDKLIGLNGLPTTVLMVHPQPEKKRVYEVILKDDRKIECCEDHLWTYYYQSHRGYNLKTSPLKELYNKKEVIGLQTKKGLYRYYLPLPRPVQHNEKNLFPSPYVMGLILGDGSFRYSNTQKAFYFSSENDELPSYVAEELQAKLKRNSEKNYNWIFQKEQLNGRKNIWVEEILVNYPELWNKKSENKFIPEDYMTSSIEQRMALLRGLLDTDGHIDTKGRISFTSVSLTMIKQVQKLCRSLGFIANISEDIRENKYSNNNNVCYTLHILCDKHIKPQLFNLSRKKNIAEKYANSMLREERRDWVAIKDIVKTDRFEDMTCFTVDADDALFLVGDYVPTHNTRLAVFDACKIAYPEHYDAESKCFITEFTSDGELRQPQKTLFITTEMDKTEIQTIMISYLSGVNEKHILTAQYEEDEEERILYAERIMEKYQDYFYLEEISDPNLTNVEALIKRYVSIEEVKVIFFDYIFTSPSLLAQFSGAKIREDSALGLMANQLKQIAKDYNVFIMSSTQVNGEGMANEGFKDERCLRGAKSLADKCDFACIVSRVTDKDLQSVSPMLKQAGLAATANSTLMEIPTHVIDIYKNRRGGLRGVRVWTRLNLGTGERKDLCITRDNNTPYPIEEFSEGILRSYKMVPYTKWKEALNGE